ncbi:hypothetical protein [Streptomyces sp. MMBL 11-3]|uniref:hypothetical protein n=1 Tax=Streptomyces sp. MMBL 11-3 TaxID=3382639 RepID=UPI0039B52183
MSERGSFIAVGTGPGLGAAAARRLGHEGHAVALIALIALMERFAIGPVVQRLGERADIRLVDAVETEVPVRG